MLPDPAVLARRHLALLLLDEALSGLDDDGAGDGDELDPDAGRLAISAGGDASAWAWSGGAWALTDGAGDEAPLEDLLEPAGDAAYRLARDYYDQPYLSATADHFAAAVQDEGRVDAELLATLRPPDGVPALLARARDLGLDA